MCFTLSLNFHASINCRLTRVALCMILHSQKLLALGASCDDLPLLWPYQAQWRLYHQWLHHQSLVRDLLAPTGNVHWLLGLILPQATNIVSPSSQHWNPPSLNYRTFLWGSSVYPVASSHSSDSGDDQLPRPFGRLCLALGMSSTDSECFKGCPSMSSPHTARCAWG